MVATVDIFGLKVLRIPRPLQEHVFISLATFAIFLTAFLLYLLVGLSLTIIPSIYIIKVSAENSRNPVSDAATTLWFGVWGVCATSVVDSTVAEGGCYGPQLGYTIPQSLLSLVGLSEELANVAETTLLTLLALHLVAAALSTIIFILSLFLHSHTVAIIALIIAIITAIIGSVVFAVDLALVIVVKANIDSLFSGADFSVQFGNAVWMILAAVILTWIAVVVLSARACYCCGVRRRGHSKSENLLVGAQE
ncbi:hypothetical protein PAXRUDRAFT_7876 [Paxillus rubicundulus Ve08.2h10]|uniref:Pali-domain-containing protein n=1 Tax=Paxillus rubicundulus Ve08.2h10 TaxID=930991 RepID=A0A0D0DYI8_9AGAM|nr:hypothetical protein PAXRUDRAFT_7876 [Paxillus rubicundulus Ve08.2h10]